jgi:hypothetical protein
MARVDVYNKVARHFAGQSAIPKAQRTEIKRKDKESETAFYKMTTFLFGLGKEALAEMAAASLDLAVKPQPEGGTKHDSGRAAANWDLLIGGGNPFSRSTSQLDPDVTPAAAYGVGERGSKGAVSASAVPKIKAAAYGYTVSGNQVAVTNGGWLHQAIGVGKPGTPQVALFNPILFAIKAPDGSGKTYAENAFPGLDAAMSSIDKKAGEAASVFVLYKVAEFNREFRKGAITRGRGR